MVECGGLENRWASRSRGFESLPLRQFKNFRPRAFDPSNTPIDGSIAALFMGLNGGKSGIWAMGIVQWIKAKIRPQTRELMLVM